MMIKMMLYLSRQIWKDLSEGSANALDHHVLPKHLIIDMIIMMFLMIMMTMMMTIVVMMMMITMSLPNA